MNKKRIWLVIPSVLFPYCVLFGLAIIFFSSKYSFFECIMEQVFRGNAWYLVAALLVVGILSIILSIICFCKSTREGWDARSLAKTAMITKLIQVPAYVLIFFWGVLLAITIFTIPFSLGLFLFDCLTLVATGLITTASAIIAIRQRIFTFKESFWVIVLQVVFCADVVASIIYFMALRKKYK